MPPKPRVLETRVEDLSKAISRRCRDMPTPCGRCKQLGLRCQVEVSSGRCTTCASQHKTCDLRVTYQEFQKLASVREKLEREMEEAEQELSDAEDRAQKARAKVRRLRKTLRRAEQKEAKKLEWEIVSLEEVEKLTAEAVGSATLELPDLSTPGHPLPEFSWDA